MVLDYIDSTVFEPVFKNELPPKTTQSMVDIAKELYFAIKSGKRIFVYGDYDMDGFCSMMVWKEVFRILNYRNFKLFQYVSRTHKLDRSILEQVEEPCVVVICDTGSSLEDRYLLVDLEMSGHTVLVIDHHNFEGKYETSMGAIRFFNVYEERDRFLGSSICGAYAALLVAKVLCEKFFQGTLSLSAKVFALAAMYADAMDMSTPAARALYNNVAMQKATLPYMFECLNKWGYKSTRRLFSFIISPVVNYSFRSERFTPLNVIATAEDRYTVMNAVRDLRKIHTETSAMIDPLSEEFNIEDFGQIKLATYVPTQEMVGWHIENYSGLIANKLSKREKCAVMTAVKCRNGYKGSYRDFFERPLLNSCKQFIPKANGHPPAFGFEFKDISYVRRHLSVLAGKLSEGTGTENIMLSSTLIRDETDIDTAALYNEYMTTQPRIRIVHKCRSIKCIRTTKYSRTYACGLPLLVRATQPLVEGQTILLEPCITKRVELRTIE